MIFCKHRWVILSEQTTLSAFELATKCFSTDLEEFTLKGRLTDTSRKLIQIAACEKCGKLKKFVEVL